MNTRHTHRWWPKYAAAFAVVLAGTILAGAYVAAAWTGQVTVSEPFCQGTQPYVWISISNPENAPARIMTSDDFQTLLSPAGGAMPSKKYQHPANGATETVVFEWLDTTVSPARRLDRASYKVTVPNANPELCPAPTTTTGPKVIGTTPEGKVIVAPGDGGPPMLVEPGAPLPVDDETPPPSTSPEPSSPAPTDPGTPTTRVQQRASSGSIARHTLPARLPVTGMSAWLILLAGGAAVVAGSSLIALSRRRARQHELDRWAGTERKRHDR